MEKLFITVLLMLTICGFAAGQNARLSGKITDEQTGEPLPGATILVKGTTNGAVSTLVGEFSLSATEGKQTLVVSFIGYATKEVPVEITRGKTNSVDIQLTSAAFEIGGVRVVGQLEGQVKALNQQLSALNIKNVVSADQIGRFPDPNVAEALQRVPGVNIERDQGEGRYVLVRGLSPKFTNINVNGEQIPSPEADVRYVALDAIPADQLSSMEISKALTPDMDGDAIGGSVNLITRTATSATPQIKASIVGGYNALMKQPNAQGSLQYGQRLGKNRKFGLMLNSSYYQNNFGSDNWEREPFDNEFELRDYQLVRTRLGLSSTMDYKFNRNNEIYLRSLYSRFSDREWRRTYLFKPEDEEIERSTKDRYESQSIMSFNLGGKHTLPKINIDYELAYAYGEQDTPYDYESTFIAGIPSTVDFGNGANFPSLKADGYLDNKSYEFDELATGNTFAKDKNITGKINIGLPFKINEVSGLFKFGGKARFKTKSYDITENVYGNLGGVPNLNEFEGGTLDKNFLKGKYQLSRNTDVQKLVGYLNANPEKFELQIEDKAIAEALEAFQAEENVYAGYVMGQFQIKKLTAVAGVRYERTVVNYKSKDVIIAPNGDLQEIKPVNGGTDYDFVLPQLNLKYAVNDLTNIRFASTLSYARPNFGEIIPAQEVNREDNEATVGNPLLKPVSALNLDLLGEKYFKNVGVISGGIFYKRLNDFIFPRVFFGSNYPLNGTPTITDIDIIQVQNGEAADLLGFEAAYQQNLTFLPGALSGLGVYLNYTYTRSNAKIQSRSADSGTETIKLPGQAEHVGNVSLSYDYKKFNARLSFNFNGKYLQEVGGNQEEDLYTKSRMQMDLSTSYAIQKRFRVFAEFLNLTNQPFQAYMGKENVVVQREFYSWWSRVGLKFDL